MSLQKTAEKHPEQPSGSMKWRRRCSLFRSRARITADGATTILWGKKRCGMFQISNGVAAPKVGWEARMNAEAESPGWLP
jgi:hypothetical protein